MQCILIVFIVNSVDFIFQKKKKGSVLVRQPIS